jgi:hypothetical protein
LEEIKFFVLMSLLLFLLLLCSGSLKLCVCVFRIVLQHHQKNRAEEKQHKALQQFFPTLVFRRFFPHYHKTDGGRTPFIISSWQL